MGRNEPITPAPELRRPLILDTMHRLTRTRMVNILALTKLSATIT